MTCYLLRHICCYFYCFDELRDLHVLTHSFPTRLSSDLSSPTDRSSAAMRRQVEANRTRIIEAAAIEQENRRLMKLLKLVETEDDEVVAARMIRSEEHTSELQSLNRIPYAVFCLKKKNKTDQLDEIHSNTNT